MTPTQDDLDKLARLTVQAAEGVAVAMFRAREGKPLQAEEQLRAANDALQSLHALLLTAGARDGREPPPRRRLCRCTLLDTPPTRRLLTLLRRRRKLPKPWTRSAGTSCLRPCRCCRGRAGEPDGRRRYRT